WRTRQPPGERGAAPRPGSGRTPDRIAAPAGRQDPVACRDRRRPACGMSIVPRRLRIAVAARDAAARGRRASLLAQSGHEFVEREAAPDALLTDGSAGTALPSPAVAIGAGEAECPGLLPANATAAQIDAALRAVAAGLRVRAASRQIR